MIRKPRFSHQRETILKIILKDGGHLHAEEIYIQAKRKISNISRGTVYRNLTTLEAIKKVTRTQGNDQINYFEAFSQPHHHFICQKCNSIRDLDTPTVRICNICVSNSTKLPFEINKSVLTLYGLCESCCSSKEESEAKQLIKLHG